MELEGEAGTFRGGAVTPQARPGGVGPGLGARRGQQVGPNLGGPVEEHSSPAGIAREAQTAPHPAQVNVLAHGASGAAWFMKAAASSASTVRLGLEPSTGG